MPGPAWKETKLGQETQLRVAESWSIPLFTPTFLVVILLGFSYNQRLRLLQDPA